jgi:serine/threonine-protein kinase RsbW
LSAAGDGHLGTTGGIADSSTVRLDLESRPQTLTIVRAMLSGIADLLTIDPELLDDLKTAISEACNNVVLHAYDGQPGPMVVRLFADAQGIRVTVQDEGVGMPSVGHSSDRPDGIGISVIRALADDVQFNRGHNGGTEVRMDFAAARDGRRLFDPPSEPAADDGVLRREAGEVVVSLSPVTLLNGVLGRLARTLAATAHFSLDRFSDVYLVTDTLAAHAATAAAGPRIGARLMAAERRLTLEVGPFRPGSATLLRADAPGRGAAPLVLLSDSVSVESDGGGDVLHVMVIDHRRD